MPISFPGLFGDWEFNPDPIAIHIGHGIYWYGIILAVAMLAGLLLCMRQAKHYGLTQDHVLDLVLWAVPSCIIGARLCREMAADFSRLWAAGQPQGEGEYWPCPQKSDYTILETTPPQETERILRAFFGFDCYLKTKEAEYRIVRGLFRPERHTLPFGTVRTQKDGRRIYAVQGGVIEIEANRERVGA